jgi:hypothetical protein
MKKSKFPKGWDEKRVGVVLAHYEKQTEEDAMAEDEDAFRNRTRTAMEVPTQLVSKIRELIAKNKASQTAEKAADVAC